MGFFNEFPHTRTYDNDLGWLIKKVKDLDVQLQNFIKLNTVKYADPIQWNISTQYEANTVVIDALTGVAYISTQPVPSGVNINTDYWTPVFTLDLVNLNKNITLRNDGDNNNATFASAVDDWLIVGGQLYKVIQDIALHTAYVVGFNIEVYSVEMFVRDYLNRVLSMIGGLDSLNTTDKHSVVAAINEVLGNIGDLNNLNTTDKDSAVDAINEVLGNIGDLNNLNTTDKDSVVNAINEVLGNIGDTLNCLIPDQFTGTDGEKIQAAFDALILTGGTIALNREYVLDRDILIQRRSNNPNFKSITIIGIGKDSGIDFNDYCIQGYDNNYRDYGGLNFINVKMHGNETAFKTDYLIRLNFQSCQIWHFKYFLWGNENTSCQSVYFNDCNINRIYTGVQYAHYQAYDVHYNNCKIELCDSFLYIGSAKVLSVTNCVIEGRNVSPAAGLKSIRIVDTYEDFYFTGNYCEDNETMIDFSTCNNQWYNHAVIQGNGFWEAQDNIKCIVLPESVSHGQILLDHNMFNIYGTGAYAISVYNTGHDLMGVQINACNGVNFAMYDPEKKLHDLADYGEDSITASVTYTVNSGSPLRFRRHGKVCSLSGLITLGENVSAGSTIFTLNNQYNAPPTRVFFLIAKLNGAAVASVHRGNIGDEGAVYCQENLTNGDLIAFDVTWICR